MNYSVSIDPIDTVTPFGNNPRQITPDAISKVAASIDLYGFRSPIIVDDDRVILAGHTRLLAAQKLGLTEVPVHIASGLSKSKKRAYRLADNRSAEESRWDFPMLTEELGELMDEGFDLADTLFDPSELANLFPDEPIEGLTDEDEVPEVQDDPVSVLGDVWVLGRHRLMCEDSTSIDAVERLIDGATIDLVHTDPPYGISETASKRTSRETNSIAKSNSHLPDFNDETTDAARDAFALCEGLAISRQVWWGANYYAHALPETANWLVWDKRVEEKQKDVNSDCELAWVRSKWSSVRIFRHLWKGLIKGSERGEKRVHPTQKPVALAKWVFNKFKIQGLVLDLFGGSGSTLLACEQMGLAAALVEREPRYCDVIIERWQELTGQEAALESGETFNGEKSKRNMGADRAA